MNNVPMEIVMENHEWKHWGTVELMEKYPILNTQCWSYCCDPMEGGWDPEVYRKITCLKDCEYDPWNRKMIPWKWRSFEEGSGWRTETPHQYLAGKKKYPYAERYTTVEGKQTRLYKRLHNF